MRMWRKITWLFPLWMGLFWMVPSLIRVESMPPPDEGMMARYRQDGSLEKRKCSWASVEGKTLVGNGMVFTANGEGDPILKSKLSGGTLQVLVSERGYASAKAMNAPLLRIALQLKEGQSIGAIVALSADLGKSQVLNSSGNIVALDDLRIGTIKIE